MSQGSTVLFMSYSFADDWAAQRLRKHLHPVLQHSAIFFNVVPDYRERDREGAEVAALEGAQIILPLISADYLGSSFVTEVVLPALEPAKKRGAVVAPLIIGHSAFLHVSTLAQFKPMNSSTNPLEAMSKLQQEEVFSKTVSLVVKAIQSDTKASVALTPPSLQTPTASLAAPEKKRDVAPKVFLCYRREDTQDAAGRLRDGLAATYGYQRVFMDIDSVPLGVDFVENVAEQIGTCSAVIVMIGKAWLSAQDKAGRRLDNPEDLVRIEIAAALQRNVPVIPVLVQDAEMPSPDDLPENIRPLARRNGIDLSGPAWKGSVERLIKELDRVMKPSSS